MVVPKIMETSCSMQAKGQGRGDKSYLGIVEPPSSTMTSKLLISNLAVFVIVGVCLPISTLIVHGIMDQRIHNINSICTLIACC